MTLGDVGSIASAVIAFLALLVSVFSIRKTNKFSTTADRLNQMLIEREKAEGIAAKSADISANLVEARKNYRLKIFNRGQGAARNIRLIDLTEQNSPLVDSDIAEKFPFPTLERHQNVEVIVVRMFITAPKIDIKLLWDDKTGSDFEKLLTLSFP